MLFSYKYLTHQIETMQTYVQFIFEDVWLTATAESDYDIERLFEKMPDLKGMIQELHYQQNKSADDFMVPLHALFEIFKTLNAEEKERIKKWFILNNDIQHLCEHGDECQPGTYAVIEVAFPKDKYPGLVKQLKRFFKNLYSSDFLKLSSVKERIGTIDDHNDQFTKLNDRDVCPFCGLSGMLNYSNSKREAYDHYFPKDKYPFNSINFRNLVPACPRCNSSYKLAKDPLEIPRKVFYPFSEIKHTIEITVNVNSRYWEELSPGDIDIQYGPADITQEIETWKDLYGIDERYRQECTSKSTGKAWLTEVFDEWKELGDAPEKYLDRLELYCKRDRYVQKRFLKKAFFEGCERAGLFDPVVKAGEG